MCETERPGWRIETPREVLEVHTHAPAGMVDDELRRATARLAEHRELPVVSILAPGELPRAELLARLTTLVEAVGAPAGIPFADVAEYARGLVTVARNAVDAAERQARLLERTMTAEDGVTLLVTTVLGAATKAPNCAGWRGEYLGRGYELSVQWLDGKSPHALIDEARAERDEAAALAATAMSAGLEECDRLRSVRDFHEQAFDHADDHLDHRTRQVERFHELTGCEREWSNVHDLGDCAYDHLNAVVHDHEQLGREVVALRARVERAERACAEGLPREVLNCHHCGAQHVDGENGAEFATRPHHTHLCHACHRTWDAGRWSFGARVPTVDWPEADGFWWCWQSPTDPNPLVVEARVYPDTSWIYHAGVSASTHVHEPHEGWRFARVVAPSCSIVAPSLSAPDVPRPEPFQLGLYRHRGGGLYDVEDLAFDSTNGAGEGRWMVLYRSHESGRLNVREVGQFTEAQTWPDGETRPRFVPASREIAPAPGNPHTVPAAEANRRGEVIVRRARAELLAIDPHCDCIMGWAARSFLMFAVDERVILGPDADALSDLAKFLAHVQDLRRLRYGLDPTVVDGPNDPRAVADGAVVARVMVRFEGREMPVAWALERLRKEEGSDAE